VKDVYELVERGKIEVRMMGEEVWMHSWC